MAVVVNNSYSGSEMKGAIAHVLARLSLVLICGGVSASFAAPIVYSFTGTATGTAGATPFTNATYTIVLTGDTNLAQFLGLADWANAVAGTISIAGIGDGSITEQVVVRTACGANPRVGMERGPGILPFANYAISGATIPGGCQLSGPLSSVALTPLLGNFSGLSTTLGAITIASISGLTYQASLPASLPASQPIPTLSGLALLLLVIVLAGSGAIRSVRRESA